jgi:hypothetical protein
MYCGVLPIDESDYAFFAAMDRLERPHEARETDIEALRRKARVRMAKLRKARKVQLVRKALAEIERALLRNHKKECHPTRKALRDREKVCMDILSSLVHE